MEDKSKKKLNESSRVKNLRKKIAEIVNLEKRCAEGDEPSEAQLEKIRSKNQLEAELDALLNPPSEKPKEDVQGAAPKQVDTSTADASQNEAEKVHPCIASGKAKAKVKAKAAPAPVKEQAPPQEPQQEVKDTQDASQNEAEKVHPCIASGKAKAKVKAKAAPPPVKEQAPPQEPQQEIKDAQDESEVVHPCIAAGKAQAKVKPKAAPPSVKAQAQAPPQEAPQDEVDDKACQHCRETLTPHAKFCMNCGTQVGQRPCTNCEVMLLVSSSFCMNCGAKAKASQPAAILESQQGPADSSGQQLEQEESAVKAAPKLTDDEREFLKVVKKYRDVIKLEDKADSGAQLEPLQLQKISGKIALIEELIRLAKVLPEHTELLDRNPDIVELLPRSLRRAPSPSPLDSCRSPSMKWEDDPVGVEDVAPSAKASTEPFEFFENVQPFADAAQKSERMKALLKGVTELSKAAFEEDALEMITRKNKWKLTLLALREKDAGVGEFSLDEEQLPPLIGFLVYKLRPELTCLSVAKVAIVPEHRRQGHGARFIDWCVRLARKQQNVSYIALSSLPEAVCFYKRMGFKQFDVQLKGNCAPDEDLVEGQVYMEKPIKGGKRKGKA